VDSVLLFVLGVVIILVGVALSIALHEIGHLVPAKLFGVKVTQYMIGFGRTLFSFKRGETEYGVKAIPLGGYISMIGMFPPGTDGGSGRNATTGFMQAMVQDARTSSAETVGEGEEDRTFYRLPVWKRIVIMFGGPFMNLLIGVVLFGVLLMGFGTAQASTTIGSVNQCVLPATTTSQKCGADATQTPAAAAGLKPGDTIVSIDGKKITSWAQSTAIVRDSAGVPLTVVIRRDGQDQTVVLTPLTNSVAKLDANGQAVKGNRESRLCGHRSGGEAGPSADHLRSSRRGSSDLRGRRRCHPPAAAHGRHLERRFRLGSARPERAGEPRRRRPRGR
jgi:membrane-associated protease RseP (regulator of RpoE activity)